MPALAFCGGFVRKLKLASPCSSLFLTDQESGVQDDTYTESYISTIGVDFVSQFQSWNAVSGQSLPELES